MNLYLENGFLDIESIAAHPSWLKVIIGARQVGKTYGTLLYHLKHNIPHILLRRTTAELELIGGSTELNPYKVFEPDYHVGLFKQGKYYLISDYDENGRTSDRGMALSLAMISHIRGFNGRQYRSIVYDEAIPEKGVSSRSSEGDSVLNAYTTINGNRELAGEPPCTLWLLANSNDINSPVLDALNLTKDILKMRRRGQELLTSEGILIAQPLSDAVIDRRKTTALMKQVSKSGSFYKMAIGNEFSYDESPLVISASLKGMRPLFGVDDLYAWENDDMIYICRAVHKIDHYEGSYGRGQCVANYLWMRRAYAANLVYFSDIALLGVFKRLFNIDY